MSTRRRIYRGLSLWNTGSAAARGPGALGRNLVRREAHKALARVLRRLGA